MLTGTSLIKCSAYCFLIEAHPDRGHRPHTIRHDLFAVWNGNCNACVLLSKLIAAFLIDYQIM